MASTTSPVRVTDRDSVEAFLGEDPVSTAVVWHRAFGMEGRREVYADGLPPHGVLGIAHPEWAEGAAGIGMHATDPAAAKALLPAWPRGPVFVHLTEEWMLPLVEAKAEHIDGGVFWLFRLDQADFVDADRSRVRPLGPEWADAVARAWEPDVDERPYVRSRIEAGHAYAVYEDDEPVAWALTHFETPKVVMMGFLHVLPPYRRKGHARSVSAALAKDILDRGKIPALHVKADNVASLELTRSLGFRKVRKQVFAEAVIA